MRGTGAKHSTVAGAGVVGGSGTRSEEAPKSAPNVTDAPPSGVTILRAVPPFVRFLENQSDLSTVVYGCCGSNRSFRRRIGAFARSIRAPRLGEGPGGRVLAAVTSSIEPGGPMYDVANWRRDRQGFGGRMRLFLRRARSLRRNGAATCRDDHLVTVFGRFRCSRHSGSRSLFPEKLAED